MTSKDRLEARIDTSKLHDALRLPLGFVESEERRAFIESYIAATQPHLDHAAYEMLATLIGGLNEAAGEGLAARVEHRSDGVWLVVAPGESEPSIEQPFVEGDLEKVTVRLPKELKDAIDRIAGAEGVSANTWYIRGMARAMGRAMRGGLHFRPGEGAGPGPRRPRGNRRGMHGFPGEEDRA